MVGESDPKRYNWLQVYDSLYKDVDERDENEAEQNFSEPNSTRKYATI